MFEPVVHLVYN